MQVSVKGSTEYNAAMLEDAVIHSEPVNFGGEQITCGSVKIGNAICKTVHIKTLSAHSHCVCGGTMVSGDHTSISHTDIEYQPWDGSTTALTAGNYFLTKDIALENDITTTGNVNLCLNGHNIAFGTGGQILPGNNSTLSICDCTASDGTINAPGKNAIYFKGVSNATVKMYGGTVIGGLNLNTVSDSGKPGELCTNCAFYLYGGTVKHARVAAVGNVQSEVYLYGGTIDSANNNGAATRKDGTIYLCGNTVLNHGEGFASIKALGAGCIDAAGYDGNPLTIYYTKENPADGEIIVKNAVNTAGFTLSLPLGKVLQAKDGNLVLATKEYTITLPSPQTGYIIAGDTAAAHGTDKTYTFTLANGYYKTAGFKVKINGAEATLDDYGQFTISNITENQTISVEGIAKDTAAPNGKITVGGQDWTEFQDDITFNLFFKAPQRVTITAEDEDGEVQQIAYYIAESKMTLDEVKALSNDNWQEYTNGFEINPNRRYMIYARISDDAGNVAYISSNGMVLDDLLPTISGIEQGKTYCQSVEVWVDDAYIDTVTLNGKPARLVDGRFTVAPETGTQTIIVTDKAGNRVERTIFVNSGHTWGDGKITKPATTTTKGEKTYTCPICGAIRTEEVPMFAELPQTGDAQTPAFWGVLMLVSGLCLGGAVLAGKKKKTK